jgi:hypothetical protein
LEENTGCGRCFESCDKNWVMTHEYFVAYKQYTQRKIVSEYCLLNKYWKIILNICMYVCVCVFCWESNPESNTC